MREDCGIKICLFISSNGLRRILVLKLRDWENLIRMIFKVTQHYGIRLIFKVFIFPLLKIIVLMVRFYSEKSYNSSKNFEAIKTHLNFIFLKHLKSMCETQMYDYQRNRVHLMVVVFCKRKRKSCLGLCSVNKYSVLGFLCVCYICS